MFLFKSGRCQSARKSQIGLGFAVVAGVLAFSTQASYASPGCDFLNNGGANITSTNTAGGINTIGANRLFATGESITSTLSGNVTNSFGQIGPQIFFNGNTTGSATHVVPSDGTFLIESDVATIGGTGSIGWTCTEPGAAAASPSASLGGLLAPVIVIGPDNTVIIGGNQQASAEIVGQNISGIIDIFPNPRFVRYNKSEELFILLGEYDLPRGDVKSSLPLLLKKLEVEVKRTTSILDSERRTEAEMLAKIAKLRAKGADFSSTKIQSHIKELRGIRKSISSHEEELGVIRSNIKLVVDDMRGVGDSEVVAQAFGYVSSSPVNANNGLSRFNLTGSKFGLAGSASTYAINAPIPVIFFADGSVSFLTGASDGEIGAGRFGLAARIQKNIVIGAYALGVIGSSKSTIGITTTDTDTRGFGGGGYGSIDFRNRISADISFNYIKTNNDITAITAASPIATGSYDGSLFTASGNLRRVFNVDGLLITPSIGATYLSSKTSAYSDSNGVAVGSTDRSEFSGDLGIRLARTIAITDSPIAVLSPWLSADTRINISDSGGTLLAGQRVFSQDAAKYSLGLGVNIGFVNGSALNLNSSFNNLGSDTESITVGLKLIVPLN